MADLQKQLASLQQQLDVSRKENNVRSLYPAIILCCVSFALKYPVLFLPPHLMTVVIYK